MKKKALIIIIIFSILTATAVSIHIYLKPIWNIGISQENNEETFLLSSQSPDEKYKLEAYKTEPGATVDFSIKVYLINGENKELIYNAYHEYQADILWIDNETVSINGKTLDLSNGEKYDWRTN